MTEFILVLGVANSVKFSKEILTLKKHTLVRTSIVWINESLLLFAVVVSCSFANQHSMTCLLKPSQIRSLI